MKYGELTLGQIEAVANKLGGMDGVQRLLSGGLMISLAEHIIDCDAQPFIPNGWKVESHKKQGSFKWDSTKIQLYLAEGQQGGKRIVGTELQKELEAQPVLNANVLDYLLAHQELIPESWKDKYVFFWGTIYRDAGGSLYVRCLGWFGGRWYWYYDWLLSGFHGSGPAACSQVSK